MTLADFVLPALKISIVLTMVTLGLGASWRDVVVLLRQPAALARVVLAMNVVIPLLAILLAVAFDLHPAVKIAIVALSVSPVPPLLPRKALKAGGHEDYVVGLLVAAALVSIVAVPASVAIYERVFDVPLRASVVSVATLVGRTVLGPLAAGMAIRHVFPAIASRVAEPLGRFAGLLLIVSALPVVFRLAPAMFSLVGDGTLLSFATFSGLGVVVGHILGGPDDHDRSVLALAAASRHPGVAMAVVQANFPDMTSALAAVVLALIVGIIVTGLYLAWHKRHVVPTSVGTRRA